MFRLMIKISCFHWYNQHYQREYSIKKQIKRKEKWEWEKLRREWDGDVENQFKSFKYKKHDVQNTSKPGNIIKDFAKTDPIKT